MLENLISPKHLEKLLRNKIQKIIIVDLRTEPEYSFSRIPGAINIPLDRIQNHISFLKDFDKIILQCTHGARSKFVFNHNLLSNLNSKILILDGGITEWKNQGYFIQYKKKTHISLARQLHIFSGTVIILNLFLYEITNMFFFLLIPLVLSIGLIQSGITNKCFFTRILAKMPWNL